MRWRRALAALLLAGCGLRPGIAQAEDALVPESSLERLSAENRQAIEAQEEALRRGLDAGAPEAELAGLYGSLGATCLVYDLLDPAADALGKAVELAPDDFRWSYLLGVVRQEEGDFEAAATRFERARTLAPKDVPTTLRLGNAQYELGRLDDAEASYRAALALEPDSAAARFGLGRIAYSRENWAEAVEDLEAVLESQPEAATVHHMLGMSYRNEGDLDRAREHLRAVGPGDVTFPDPVMEVGRVRPGGARVDLKAANRAIRVDGDLPEALEILERAEEEDPEDPLVQYNIGWVLLQLEREEEAIGHLERALEIDPEYRNAHVNLALALANRGRLAEAEAHLARAIELDPLDHEAKLQRARILAARGEREPARREAAEVAEIESAPLQVRAVASLLAARWATEAGDREAAATWLERAVELEPRDPRFRAEVAGAWAELGRVEEASEQVRSAIRLGLSAAARVQLASGLVAVGREALALTALVVGEENAADRVTLEHARARLLATARDPEVRDPAAALEVAQRAFRDRPDAETGQTLAMALAAGGRFEDAAAVQRRIVETLPEGTPARKEAEARLHLYLEGRVLAGPAPLVSPPS